MRKALLIVSSVLLLVAAAPTRTDWKDVDQAIGRAGSLLPLSAFPSSANASGTPTAFPSNRRWLSDRGRLSRRPAAVT